MTEIVEERRRRISGFISGYLLERGWITLEQLDAALERQLELLVQKRPAPLGELLVTMGALTRAQLEEAMARVSEETKSV